MVAPTEMSDAELEAELEPFQDLMFSMIDKTIKDNNERGFRVCWNSKTDKPEILEECTGTECGVKMPSCPGTSVIIHPEDMPEYEAKKHLKGFASFHTHPKGGSWIPSPGDVAGAFGARDIVDCVGIGTRARAPRKKKALQCYKNQQDFELIQPFLHAYFGNKYGEEVTTLMAKASFAPSDQTIFRRVFSWEL
jgi:hypothetical protein